MRTNLGGWSLGGNNTTDSRLGCQAVIKGDVVCEFPMYTRNYVQEGGGIQLGKSDKKAKAEEVAK